MDSPEEKIVTELKIKDDLFMEEKLDNFCLIGSNIRKCDYGGVNLK
jgi:hypothetical protein